MSITSLKHSLSSLKLAKKSTSALFKDATFSSLISRYFDSEVLNNPFMSPSITTSSNTIYYNTIYQLIREKDTTKQEIRAIALKFQKILSLEIQQKTIQRLLQGEYANHLTNNGGTYEIFPCRFRCEHCKLEFSAKETRNKSKLLNINLFPTVTTIWHHERLTDNLISIGELVNNPFKSTRNNKANLFTPLNLIVVYHGNHSANAALYENNSTIEQHYTYDISEWFQSIYYDPQTNTFNHLACGNELSPSNIFHENVGHIYEITRLLYQNQIIP